MPIFHLQQRSYLDILFTPSCQATTIGSSQQPQLVNERLAERQGKMKANHDRHAGPNLPPLFVGQTVRILDQPTGKSLIPGTVTKVCDEPRSYEVSTPNGTTVRHNRSHLRELLAKTRDCRPQAVAPTAAKRVRFDESPSHVLFPQHSQGLAMRTPQLTKRQCQKPTDAKKPTCLRQPQTTRSGRTTRPPARYTDN